MLLLGQRKIYVADLGMQIISLAIFQKTSQGHLLLRSLTQKQWTTDSSVKEFCPQSLKSILHTWRKKEKIQQGEKLTIALPSQMVLTRFLKLPNGQFEDIRSIIAFEAQQCIPFPLYEIVWDYKILSSSAQESREVVLVATKKLPLLALRKIIVEAGFSIERTDVAPIAIYNAFRFNYPKIKGCSLIFDININSANLIFSESDKFFIRTIPFITHQDPLLASQGSKIYQAKPPLIHKSQNENTEKQKEIDRSIAFYCTHQKGSPPHQVFVCGDIESRSSLLKFFNKEMPISLFNPFHNIKVFFKETTQIHVLATIVGLAMHALQNVSGSIKVNLICPEAVQELNLVRRKSILTTVSVCSALVLACSWLYFAYHTLSKRAALKKNNIQISALSDHAYQIQKIWDRHEALKVHLAPLVKAVTERALWPAILRTLEACLPSEFIWITRLEFIFENQPVLPAPAKWNETRMYHSLKGAEQLLIEGLYLENPEQATVVDQFAQNLSQTSLFTVSDKTHIIRVRDTPDGEHWAYRYTLVLPLNFLK